MISPDELDRCRDWIGSEESEEEVLTAALVARFRATCSIQGDEAAETEAPDPLIHFCLCQPVAPMAMLGEDGHAARGGFLPPVPLPRRMWAGSRIVFHDDLRIGDLVRRHSRIADVEIKHGRTGTLCFVTVDHRFTAGNRLCVEDRQTLVYRAPADGPPSPGQPVPAGETVVAVDVTPTLLFRYSALTFNGHRIHYDAPYARDVENYPGLVVHGPLQATLLLKLATRVAGRPPRRFNFRSASALYAGEPMLLNAGPLVGGTLSLWTARPDGVPAMHAEAQW